MKYIHLCFNILNIIILWSHKKNTTKCLIIRDKAHKINIFFIVLGIFPIFHSRPSIPPPSSISILLGGFSFQCRFCRLHSLDRLGLLGSFVHLAGNFLDNHLLFSTVRQHKGALTLINLPTNTSFLIWTTRIFLYWGGKCGFM